MKKNLFIPQNTKNIHKQFLLLLILFFSGNAWGQTTYTFSTKSWGASPANWTSGKDGNGFTSGQGLQITTGSTGAFGNSPISFSNISKVVVNYATNASAGAGTISAYAVSGTSAAAQSGTQISTTQSVTTTGGTTPRSMTFTPSSSLTGYLQIYVTCTTNSLYIYSVEITYGSSTCNSPTAPTATSITSSSATLGWTAPTSAPASGYQYYLSTSSTAPDASTTPTGNVSTGTSANAVVSANTTYYWWVRSNCSVSDKSSWVSGGSFTTPQIAASFPYNENFEGSNANNWGFANGAQTNKWIVGTATQNGGTQSLYISNNGSANAYTISPSSASSVVYAYRDITIPAGSTAASISFDYKLVGEGTVSIPYDYFKVWLVPTSYTPVASASTVITPLAGRVQVGSNFVNQPTYTTYSNNAVDVSSFAGQTMRLVFEWINDSSGGAQPPASIDNLALALPSASTTVSTTSLTGFAATTASDSAQQSFTVSGVSLGSNNITITPSAGYQISTTSGSGYSSTPIVLTPASGTVASTTIYAVLKKSATIGAANGTITVSSLAVTPDKTINLTGTITKSTFTSIASGNWETVSTWDLNAVPGAADNVVIAAAHTVTATTSQTRDSGTTTTVTGTLATNASYLNNGITTINGTFQINAGGWGGGSVDFVYGSAGNLIFNHSNSSEYGSIDATHRYWPAASGPVNVTINSSSPINLGVARTVTGVLQVAAGFRNLGNITMGTNGTLRLNSGYSWLNAGSPIYGTSSTLIYNSGGSPARSNEWTASTGTVGTTAGLPQNVQVSNSTTVNFPNGSTNNFRANGILTIDSGSFLYQNYSGGSAGLIVGGNFILNGTLGLGSNEGGDITVGGNWTQAATATFQPNGRKVIFNGTVAQTIQKVGGGAIDFDKIEINKTNATMLLLVTL